MVYEKSRALLIPCFSFRLCILRLSCPLLNNLRIKSSFENKLFLQFCTVREYKEYLDFTGSGHCHFPIRFLFLIVKQYQTTWDIADYRIGFCKSIIRKTGTLNRQFTIFASSLFDIQIAESNTSSIVQHVIFLSTKETATAEHLQIAGRSDSRNASNQCCGSITLWYGSGSMPLTYGSRFGPGTGFGSGSYYFRHGPSKRQQKTIFF